MIRAVLFDLGDTLLLYRGIDVQSAFREGAALAHAWLVEKGMPVGPFDRFWRKLFWQIVLRDLYCRLVRQEFCVVDVIRRHHYGRGVRLSDGDFIELVRRWYGPMGEHAHMEAGIHETLGRLEGMGLKLAIVSNVPVPGMLVDEQLAAHGLLEFFPVRIYSSDFGERKPRRRLFTEALEAMGVPASQAAFVGDRIYSDLQGAKQLGLTSILKPSRYSSWRPLRPDHRIERLGELPALLARINRDGTSRQGG